MGLVKWSIFLRDYSAKTITMEIVAELTFTSKRRVILLWFLEKRGLLMIFFKLIMCFVVRLLIAMHLINELFIILLNKFEIYFFSLLDES